MKVRVTSLFWILLLLLSLGACSMKGIETGPRDNTRQQGPKQEGTHNYSFQYASTGKCAGWAAPGLLMWWWSRRIHRQALTRVTDAIEETDLGQLKRNVKSKGNGNDRAQRLIHSIVNPKKRWSFHEDIRGRA